MSTASFSPRRPPAPTERPGFAAGAVPRGSALTIGNYVACVSAGKKTKQKKTNVQNFNWLNKVKSVWPVFGCASEGLSGRVEELKTFLGFKAVGEAGGKLGVGFLSPGV